MAGRCFIIPPHIFRAMAESEHLEESARKEALACLHHYQKFVPNDKDHYHPRTYAHDQPHPHQPQAGESGQTGSSSSGTSRQGIVPPQIFQKMAESSELDEQARAGASRDLEHLRTVHERVHEQQQQQLGISHKKHPKTAEPAAAQRTVYTANNSEVESDLPGKLLRKEGQAAVEDQAANEAYDNIGDVVKVYAEFFDWKSIDNKNAPLVSSVHFGQQYQNAFWDPERMQMVYGDGGEFITNFTRAIDVIGHELTHAVTEHTSPLAYWGQSGALNEHISDVFGIIVKQWKQQEDAANADWLIGEDCILPGVKGVALRSMKAPGTAYDDPRFGKDPQPDNYKDYQVTAEDNGGVHIYSGIPNKAYYLASVAFGGFSWEKAGQIWWKTMRSGKVPARSTFIQFADLTVETARELYDENAATIVRKAWDEVGVTSQKSGPSK